MAASQPAAEARVSVTRSAGSLVVEVAEYVPSWHLPAETRLARGWRGLVESVAIDPAYAGGPPRFVYADVPAGPDQVVAGRYELAASAGETDVAVKIVDVLGSEVLVVAGVRVDSQ